jgi:hypothetical protein
VWQTVIREIVTMDGQLVAVTEQGVPLRGFQPGDYVTNKASSVLYVLKERWIGSEHVLPAWLVRMPNETRYGKWMPEESMVLATQEQIDRFWRKKGQRSEVGRARSREELEAIRLERGYARGWTDRILAARGGRR